MEKIIIAAVSLNNVIGKEGKTSWHSKKELEHFKITTLGFPVLIGRKTWDTLQKPLVNRLNIIITRNQSLSFSHPNVVIFNTIFDALNYCETEGFEKLFIIGGAEIFNQTISISDKIILSILNFETDGDKYFPLIDKDIWDLELKTDFGEFIVYNYSKKKL